MNAQVQESTAIAVIPPKPPTVIERAIAVFSAVPSEESLRDLAQKSATITEITNEAGKQQCHAARMVLKNARLEITRVGEEGRDDAVKTSQAIIARQKALIKITQVEEERLAAIQKTWDDRIAAEKEAAIQREIARTAEIQRRIDGMRGWPVNASGQSSLLIGQMLTQAQAFRIEADVFQERSGEATAVLEASTTALVGLLAVAKAHEEAQEQLKRDQAELAQRRAADAERDRLAKIESDRLAKEVADQRAAEAREQAEANRRERERIAKEDADAKAIRDAEDKRLNEERAKQEAADKAARDAVADRLRKEREENERIASVRQAELDAQAEAQRVSNVAETKRLAHLQAEIDRKQAALVEAQKPKPEPVKVRTVERPSAAQIVACVAAHYSVSLEMAAKWVQHAKIELQGVAA